MPIDTNHEIEFSFLLAGIATELNSLYAENWRLARQQHLPGKDMKVLILNWIRWCNLTAKSLYENLCCSHCEVNKISYWCETHISLLSRSENALLFSGRHSHLIEYKKKCKSSCIRKITNSNKSECIDGVKFILSAPRNHSM